MRMYSWNTAESRNTDAMAAGRDEIDFGEPINCAKEMKLSKSKGKENDPNTVESC